jgi:hypothetical protein
MGFMRKALFLGTGGLSGMAGVRANSKKERTAKATEQQVRLTRQTSNTAGRTSTGRRWKVVCPECRQEFLSPKSPNIGCPACRTRVCVERVGAGVLAKRVVGSAPAPTEARSSGNGAAAVADAARAQALAAGATPADAQAAAAYAAVAHAAGRDDAISVEPLRESGAEGVVTELGRLADLHGRGALTDQEFAAAKAKVLGAT